ncbi:MAG: DUF4912 domain-containing protein [Nitrospirae bacterium]|nr:DUF4912 domain-containing protein [Nitrospirota bacterium]
MTKKELESQTIMELRSLAGKSEVPLRRSWTKSEIVAAILRTTSPKRGRKPKPVVVKPPKPEPVQKKTKPASVAVKQPSSNIRRAVETPPQGVVTPVAATPKRAAATRSAVADKPHVSRKSADRRSVPDVTPHTSIESNLTALMARDPHTLFVYWELQDSIPCEGISLRLHDLTSRDKHGVSDCYEYPVGCRTGGRYLFLRLPGRRFVCEMVSSAKGRYVVLARSGEVETPTDRMTVPAQAEAARLYETVFGAQAGAEIGMAEIVSPSSRIF